LKSVFFLILVTVIWGSTFPIFKIALPGVSPFAFNAIRFIIAGVASLFLTKKHAVKAGLILGILWGLGSLAQIKGISMTTASKSGFITSLYIVIVPFFSYLIEKQKLKRLQLIGFPLAFIGSYFLSGGIEGFNAGDFLNLIAACLFALQVVLITRISKNHKAVEMLSVQFFTAAAINLVAGLGQSWAMSAFTIGIVIYAALVPSLFTLFLQMKYQKNVGSNTTALIFVGEPVFAMLFSILFIGEKVSFSQMSGGGLLIISIILASLGKKKDTLPSKAS